ncbi:MAG: hypothetical protein M3P18_15370, partial [Actinomycetota bacterium]|nr:hypothetical protein [Actinomycetota bacterium]
MAEDRGHIDDPGYSAGQTDAGVGAPDSDSGAFAPTTPGIGAGFGSDVFGAGDSELSTRSPVTGARKSSSSRKRSTARKTTGRKTTARKATGT